MKDILKKFIVYLVLWCIILPILYLLIKNYDFDWNMINRITTNKYYVIFLVLSIIISLSLYWNQNNKIKLILSLIMCVNCLYLFFLFFIWNIWLTQTQGLFILWFLVLWFVSIYIKNWFWYIIIWLSILWILVILFLWAIPLFDEWPDISWFENSFNTQLITYSRTYLDEDHAQIDKDNKIYKIYQWLSNYDLKINDSESQIIFKADDYYENVFWFIVFKWGGFVKIPPQSAILINKDFEIEILAWDIKYYPTSQTSFSFTWEILPVLEEDKNIIDIVNSRYYENLKLYIKRSEVNFIENKTLLKISQWTLNVLSKLFPKKYDNNIENLQKYLDIFNINLDEKTELKNEQSVKWIMNVLKWSVKKWVEMTD